VSAIMAIHRGVVYITTPSEVLDEFTKKNVITNIYMYNNCYLLINF